MRTFLLFLLLSFVSCTGLFSQNDTTTVRVVLKSGSVYTGEVILKNEEVLMLKDLNGARFQFQIKEIKSISEQSPDDKNITEQNPSNQGVPETDFCSIVETGICSSSARKSFENEYFAQISISFGNKKTLGKNLFTGLGAGYLFCLGNNPPAKPTLIPVFTKAVLTTGKKPNALHLGIESGYAFSTNDACKGGPFTSISTGITFRLNDKTALYTSVYGAVYSIKSDLTEVSPTTGSFTYYGSTTMNSIGLKAGIRF